MQSLTEFFAANDAMLAARDREEKRRWNKLHPRKAKRSDAKRKAEARYRKRNLAKTNAWKAHRRAAKLQATPPWADRKAIEAVYAEARHAGLTVDHIYPLKGRNSCGLHVPWNLQLLTQVENSAKGNRVGEPRQSAT
jgi:hypothetical protein